MLIHQFPQTLFGNAERLRIAPGLPKPTYCLVPIGGGAFYDVISKSVKPFGNRISRSAAGISGYSNFVSTDVTTPSMGVDTAPISVVALLHNIGTGVNGYITPVLGTYAPLSIKNSGGTDITIRMSWAAGSTTSATLGTGSGGVAGIAARITDANGQQVFSDGVAVIDQAVSSYWATSTTSRMYAPISESTHGVLVLALWHNNDIGSALARKLSADPRAIFAPRRIWVPTASSLGTIYHVVYLDGETTPTKAQIISGLSWSPAKGAGSVGASASDTFTFTALDTLNPGTAYRVAYVYVGSPEDSDVLVSDVITTEGGGGTTYNVSRTESSSSADTQEATWGDVPVLSDPGVIDILALSARPQVTVTY